MRLIAASWKFVVGIKYRYRIVIQLFAEIYTVVYEQTFIYRTIFHGYGEIGLVSKHLSKPNVALREIGIIFVCLLKPNL
jgi:hypothetical protein